MTFISLVWEIVPNSENTILSTGIIIIIWKIYKQSNGENQEFTVEKGVNHNITHFPLHLYYY